MTGLRVVIILPMLMAFILAVASHKDHRLHAREGGNHDGPSRAACTNNPALYDYFPPCSTTKNTGTSTTSTSTSTASDSSEEVDSTTGSTTSLQRAHWCRFSNGSYLSYGASFIHGTCSVCECTKSRLIFCKPIQCMPTYCVDNTMPSRRTGECCTKCAYEPTSDYCVYSNKSYPHGTILKSVEGKMQCWCQLGQIECRNYMVALGSNLLSDGIAVYIIVIVLIIVVVFGLLLCCGCTIGFYYYYQRHQHTFQQAYDEYVNSAGWQPMNDGEEFVVDPTAEEKSLEAEKYQSSTGVSESVPPPYAAYASEQEQK